MSELDEALARHAAETGARARDEAYIADHGFGWVPTEVTPGLREFVADFVRRVPASAGDPGYWVTTSGTPTAHIVEKPVRLFFDPDLTPAMKATRRRRVQAMRRDSVGSTRVLRVDEEYGDRVRVWFDLVLVDGTWHPARGVPAGNFDPNPWLDRTSITSVDMDALAKNAMVRYLRQH